MGSASNENRQFSATASFYKIAHNGSHVFSRAHTLSLYLRTETWLLDVACVCSCESPKKRRRVSFFCRTRIYSFTIKSETARDAFNIWPNIYSRTRASIPKIPVAANDSTILTLGAHSFMDAGSVATASNENPSREKLISIETRMCEHYGNCSTVFFFAFPILLAKLTV